MRIRDFSLSFRKQTNQTEINQNNTALNNQALQKTENERVGKAAIRSDAVVLSSSVRNRTTESDAESDRRAKLDAIKQKVADGSYKVEREAVAVALIRDLGL